MGKDDGSLILAAMGGAGRKFQTVIHARLMIKSTPPTMNGAVEGGQKRRNVQKREDAPLRSINVPVASSPLACFLVRRIMADLVIGLLKCHIKAINGARVLKPSLVSN
jgi:hypothetical protein